MRRDASTPLGWLHYEVDVWHERVKAEEQPYVRATRLFQDGRGKPRFLRITIELDPDDLVDPE